MSTTQERFKKKLKELVEHGGEFEFVDDRQFANTGRWSAVPVDEVASPRFVSYSFQGDYGSFERDGKFGSGWPYVKWSSPNEVSETIAGIVSYLKGAH